jgi:hypothetical protein
MPPPEKKGGLNFLSISSKSQMRFREVRIQSVMMLRQRKTIGLAAITVILACAFALTVFEITIRWFVPGSLWQFRDTTADWEIDPRLGWKQKGGLDVTSRENLERKGWLVRFQTNEDGLTPFTARRTKTPKILRIMIFGDSAVVGRAVPQDHAIHAQLEKLLKMAGLSAEVINAGVQGYSTDQALLRMQQLVPLYQPDVVIYGLCSNDFGGNISREAYGLPKPMFMLNDHNNLQEIPPSITNNGEIHSFGSGPSKWLQKSAVYRLLYPAIVKVRATFMNWEQRNLLGLASEYYYRREAIEDIDWNLLSALLKNMDSYSRKHGAKFYFYAHPAVEEVWTPYIAANLKELGLSASDYDQFAIEKRLTKVAKSISVSFIPMIDYFLANQSRGPFHLLPRDPHANQAGYHQPSELNIVSHSQRRCCSERDRGSGTR